MLRTTKIIFIGLVVCPLLQATIFDNRFFPFLQRPYIVVPDRPSHSSFDVFFTTASQTFGKNDQEVGLPELTGVYNQGAVAQSFVALGCPNPLPSRFQNKKIIWNMQGKIQAQGFEFSLRKRIMSDFYLGFYWYFMRVDSTSAFFLNLIDSDLPRNLQPGDELELDRVRRMMNFTSGLQTNDHSSQTGFGDFDCYAMWRRKWDYTLKFRSIIAQASIGALMPAGQSRELDKPTSVPFGGNGFWGAYIAGQSEFEIKEDWKAGLFLRVSKRFRREKCERVPLHKEPFTYAPFLTPVCVNPGATFVFSTWVDFENIREGLGARVLYTLRNHWEDAWDIACCPPKGGVDLDHIQDLTSWASDYITLNVFYDFGKTKVCRSFEPIIFAVWDIPSNMLSTFNVVKTNKISLGVELSFN